MDTRTERRNAVTTHPVGRVLPSFLSSIPTHVSRLSPALLPFAQSALAEANEALTPATPAEFLDELSGCLALVVPTGMNEGERREWLGNAAVTLRGIPLDLLRPACFTAKRTCDHPAKIVPAIVRETDAAWSIRRRAKSEVLDAMAKMREEPPLAKGDRCTPEQADRIRRACGIRYDDDGREKPADWIPVEQRKSPTRADYIAWGVDPADIPAEAA